MFRHPLVRSAIYRAASARDRRAVHLALADATDPEADPDRRAWHLAAAAQGPDEEVALELERSAGRAQARGGFAAAAAFLQRAVALTQDPGRRAIRALAAAEAAFQAGLADAALRLVATAEAAPLDEVQRARVDLVRGQVAFASGLASDAPSLLLKAARRLERFDLELARQTYLDRLGRRNGRSRASRWRGRPAGDLPRHPGPSSEAWSSATTRPAARRARPADDRRTRRSDSDVAASSESSPRYPGGGRFALGLDGYGGQQRGMGQRRRVCDLGEAGPARPRSGRACAAAVPPLRLGHGARLDRRLKRVPPRTWPRPTAWRRRSVA